MDKIFINNLLAQAIIGLNADEREEIQDILISLELFADLRQAGLKDDINHSINYSTLAKRVVAYVEISSRFTVEALAEDIATLCLEHPGINRVKVRVEKPAAAKRAAAVGVEIDRSRSA